MPFGAEQAARYVRQLAELATAVDPGQQIRPLRLDFLTHPGHYQAAKWTGCGCQVEIPPLIWHNKQVLDLRGPSLRVRILSF